MNKNDYPLSLKADTFNGLIADFDTMLRKVITDMETKGAEEGKVAIDLKITLAKDQTPDPEITAYEAMRDIIAPRFDHKVTGSITLKDSKTGSLSGKRELVWDREACQYVLRDLNGAQTTIFDYEKPAAGDVVDADFSPVDEDHQLPPGIAGMLPEAAGEAAEEDDAGEGEEDPEQ